MTLDAIAEWLDALYLLGLRIHVLVYLLTYTVGSRRIKPAISLKWLKIERKLLLTAYTKSYAGFWLPLKCMTLNDPWARFKVIDSLNAAKITKYCLVMTPTPCRVAGWERSIIISIRPTYTCARLHTYYLHSWLGANKTCNISEMVEDKAKHNINSLYKVVHGLLIAAKIYDLEWPLSEIYDHWFLKCRKMSKCSLVMSLRRHAESFAFGKP